MLFIQLVPRYQPLQCGSAPRLISKVVHKCSDPNILFSNYWCVKNTYVPHSIDLVWKIYVNELQTGYRLEASILRFYHPFQGDCIVIIIFYAVLCNSLSLSLSLLSICLMFCVSIYLLYLYACFSFLSFTHSPSLSISPSLYISPSLSLSLYPSLFLCFCLYF